MISSLQRPIALPAFPCELRGVWSGNCNEAGGSCRKTLVTLCEVASRFLGLCVVCCCLRCNLKSAARCYFWRCADGVYDPRLRQRPSHQQDLALSFSALEPSWECRKQFICDGFERLAAAGKVPSPNTTSLRRDVLRSSIQPNMSAHLAVVGRQEIGSRGGNPAPGPQVHQRHRASDGSRMRPKRRRAVRADNKDDRRRPAAMGISFPIP